MKIRVLCMVENNASDWFVFISRIAPFKIAIKRYILVCKRAYDTHDNCCLYGTEQPLSNSASAESDFDPAALDSFCSYHLSNNVLSEFYLNSNDPIVPIYYTVGSSYFNIPYILTPQDVSSSHTACERPDFTWPSQLLVRSLHTILMLDIRGNRSLFSRESASLR